MRLATWNVNSLKVRLPQVLDWIGLYQPDVLCLQETKLEDANFPAEEIAAAGYRAAFAGQKTYNGVAILSKSLGTDIASAIPGFPDQQKRVLAATVDGVRVICVYVPNGQSVDSDKYRYKMQWLDAFAGWLKTELAKHPKLAVLGDFNIAPAPEDVYDPQAWEGRVLFSPPERDALNRLFQAGLKDAFRLFDQLPQSYSWWDYRMNSFRRNMGLRIDHILLSDGLSGVCASCAIDTPTRALERPSDHAPVIADLSI
jgi:exodeoxyribonuclease-3